MEGGLDGDFKALVTTDEFDGPENSEKSEYADELQLLGVLVKKQED